MRLNVYAEEITDRIEIIEKETKDGKFTGLRIYLELPVTENVCKICGVLERFAPFKRQCFDGSPEAGFVEGGHVWTPLQIHGPFMHHPGDDDSSAVTFWGKRDLREVLKKALAMLDKHYEGR